MKKITKIAVAATIMAAAMPTAAQSNVGMLRASGTKAVAIMKADKDTKFVPNKKNTALSAVRKQSTKLKEGETTVKLTCNFITIDDTMFPDGVQIFPTNSSDIYQVWDEGEGYKTELPAGSYDMMGTFFTQEGYCYILKENVNLTTDATVTFDAHDATMELNKFTAYNPDGELFKVDKKIYDENYNFIGVDKGNANFVFEYYDLFRKSDNQYLMQGMSHGIAPVYINQLSDRFVFVDQRFYGNDSDGTIPCIWANHFYINGDDKLLSNDPKNYFYHEEEFASSKAGLTSDKAIGAGYELAWNGANVASGAVGLDNGDVIKLWVNAPLEPKNKADRFNMLVHPIMNDYAKQEILEFTDEYGNVIFSDTMITWQQIAAPVILLEDGVKKYCYAGPTTNYLTDNDWCSQYYIAEASEPHKKICYPGNSTFSFSNDEKTGKFGDNTPVNMIAQLDQDEMGTVYPRFVCDYIGRYCEERCVDAAMCKVTLKVNGQEITTIEDWDGPQPLQYSNMDSYFSPWNNPDRVKGVTDLTFDNQNIVVDGMQGRNLTSIHFDETAEDHCPPTMTMLQMRDNNGKITDRFETAADAKVTFSCGDFVQHGDYPAYWFDCELPDVDVSVSLNGQEDWQPLAITEDSEAYAPVAFGHVFTADVSGLDADGWYDLKFKLTDAAGNTQEQTVSPAFRIGNMLSGIGGVKIGNATEVARYTVDGRAISAPQAGVNIVKMSDGSVKKVWVK